MKIKLAILENDQNYLNRIVSVFNTKYSDSFEVYSFTDVEVAMNTLESAKIDVLVANDFFDIDVDSLPRRCGFAYFVDSSDVDTIKDVRAICKFQKVDLIYKQILSIYSEKAGDLIGMKMNDGSCKLVAFCPISGGTGASTMAAAAAMHWASKGKKVLFLSIDPFGGSDSFFSGEGQFDMSDIVYALKSKKVNVAMKLESCVKQDNSGVCFFSQAKIALDMLELTTSDILSLISEIKLVGAYEVVVLDMSFALDKAHMEIFKKLHSVVVVGDGSEISNLKLYRVVNALRILEQGSDDLVLNRMHLAYNKFSNKTSKVLDDLGITNIGGVPRYEHATTEQVLKQLAPMNMFDKII